MKNFRDELFSEGLALIKNKKVVTTISVTALVIAATTITLKLFVHHQGYPDNSKDIKDALKSGVEEGGFEVEADTQSTIGTSKIHHGLYTQLEVRTHDIEHGVEVLAARLMQAAKKGLEKLSQGSD